jgi:dipeptidyl aminopeptidase/acylaminoacyl peptidase
VWTPPTGEYLLLADPVYYPSLEALAAPMHKLAGIRVNPVLNSIHGRHGATSPRLVRVEDGGVVPLALPPDLQVLGVDFSADGRRFALTVATSDHIGLWVGGVDERLREVEDVALNTLIADAVSWTPDQEHLVCLRVPERGPTPEPPAIPAGPETAEGEGASARSTYEAGNLLQTAYDDELFKYYFVSEPVIVDPADGSATVIGEAGFYTEVDFSPDGEYILVERLVGPWSHEVAYWRFGQKIEVWNALGEPVAEVAVLPLADAVPVHGVRTGPRMVFWRATAPQDLYWIEAIDGGDPVAEVPHRDRIMVLREPFTGEPSEVFRAEHRVWDVAWGTDGALMLGQYERMRRWYHVWLLDVDEGTARLWYDLDAGDSYGNPGYPVFTQLPNGEWVMRQNGTGVYFSGTGATEDGDRPFLDLRDLETGEAERLFRCAPDRYEFFEAFAGSDDRFVFRSESPTEVPNYHLATLGGEIEPEEGEATRSMTSIPITRFEDPSPQLRQITSRIVHYERADGVPLSFNLYLPPGYTGGTLLPTVVSAYPLEYSDASTAGQTRGSDRRFMRIYGSSHLFFLLRGYAVLDRTAMPMIGDPETTYDTFTEQLVADAEAAVAKAVEMGVADPERIGVIGHSHGALMVANLLAHTDLFSAGIARSGSYNKTNQPFGFQSERRSLYEARDVYIQVSPLFFADRIDEPILIIHGADDSNPGTLTSQSEVFYEAVRSSGGTARLVLLPFEDHGYIARESVEHVLWEQLRWFDMYLGGGEESR